MFTPKNTDNNQVLFIASYPPRACGIATYSQDLINAVQEKFSSFSVKVCALEEDGTVRKYSDEVKYVLNSCDREAYIELANKINTDDAVKMVFVQHEFGLFGGDYGEYLLQLLYSLNKPVSITFHTVLPKPDEKRKTIVQTIVQACNEIVVMTNHSSAILQNEYNIPDHKISIIPHGTHIVEWKNKRVIKNAYQLERRLVLSTFGLLSANKSIETALDALTGIVEKFPNVLYLILGKTHPEVVKSEGEIYREYLENKVEELGLQDNVHFVNKYLDLPELLEYLCLTDVYLFTSKDPHQAVSGTFAYAMSSACPVISTPIPHALEMLQDNAGTIIDFQDSEQLAAATIRLLGNDKLREEMGRNAFHQTRASVWENTANSHAELFNQYVDKKQSLTYRLPQIHLEHIYALTNDFGMIQFSDICDPDINSGYTLDDNARALIAICMHYNQFRESGDIDLLNTYLNFIEYCQQPNGKFLNYVDKEGEFHVQNDYNNLEDSNGRTIWALGTLIAHQHIMPETLFVQANKIFEKAIDNISQIESPRAIAFAVKGLYHYQITQKDNVQPIINLLATKLLEKYNRVSDTNWKWFEEYLTYTNSTLPEAMLYAYLATNNPAYKMIAHVTFEFLLSHLFINGTIKVISNRGWCQKGTVPNQYGEQPIDVSCTIQALDLFYWVFKDEAYREKMEIAFSWFLGNNHLNQIVYNPLTGGSYDGIEEHSVNLNQGAESTVCYLTARLTVEKVKNAAIEKRPKRIIPRKKELVYSTRWPVFKRYPKRIKQVAE
jgi:glycosyltransferase involved in cell wall biosynthesis